MKRGITVVEMLVALTVIAIIAVITYALIGRARNATDVATCLSKLSRLNLALQAYRAEYGAAEEVKGAVAQLGLPSNLSNLSTWRGQSRTEWESIAYCSRAQMGSGASPARGKVRYFYTPVHGGGKGWEAANAILGGQMPILVCIFHNPVGHDVNDPTKQHTLNIASLSGAVKTRVIRGMDIFHFDLLTYAYLTEGGR